MRIESRGWEGLSCQKGYRAQTAPAAPSCARRPRAASSGVRSAYDDPRVIVPARRLLLRRRVGGYWRQLPARLAAPRRTAVDLNRPLVRRLGRALVRCAAGWRARPRALRHGSRSPPLRWRQRHPFPRPTPLPPWQRGCTCLRASWRPWTRPACPMSMRRRARHRPKG